MFNRFPGTFDEINEYEMVMISPVSTSPVLTVGTQKIRYGFFFRSKPSDAFRAVVIAKVIPKTEGSITSP